jgi:hypothetical protein
MAEGGPRRGLRPHRGVAAVATATLAGSLLLTGCGSTEAGPTVGALVTTADPDPSAGATPSAGSDADPQDDAARATTAAVKLKGGGTFVLDDGGVLATMKLPADRAQEDVVALKDFLRRSHSPSTRIASVTVANHSSKAFSLNGFEIGTTTGTVKLYPVSTFVNLALALPGVGGNAELVSAGTVVSLTSAAAVPAGREITTLVATQRPVGTVTAVTYRHGSSSTTLRPLWEIRQAAAKQAREQAKAARRLARQQAREARKKARN